MFQIFPRQFFRLSKPFFNPSNSFFLQCRSPICSEINEIYRKGIDDIRKKQGFIIDMDGVVYYHKNLVPGVKDFVKWLQKEEKKFLFLTNSSERSPKELQRKLSHLGIEVAESNFYTSALSTASFLQNQKPNGTAFVIGEPGLIKALYSEGYSMSDVNPDYVVVGETKNYSFEGVQRAVNFVREGAQLIGTNCDLVDKVEDGWFPACGSLIAPIELASGVKAYFVGKPNPLMMRSAMEKLGCTAEDSVIIGDRMETDIVAGIESGIDTVLVLSGVANMQDLKKFSFRPRFVAKSIASIISF